MATAAAGSQTPCCVQLSLEGARTLVKEIQEVPWWLHQEMESLLDKIMTLLVIKQSLEHLIDKVFQVL